MNLKDVPVSHPDANISSQKMEFDFNNSNNRD